MTQCGKNGFSSVSNRIPHRGKYCANVIIFLKKKRKKINLLISYSYQCNGHLFMTNPIPLSSSSLSRHITACGGNPDLRFQLLQSSQCSRSVGGSLLMSSRLCGRVLRAVRPGIHQRRPRQRAFLDMCVVQLPPAWNMSSRNR